MNEIDFEYVEDASTLILRAGPDAPTERLGLVGTALARLADAYALRHRGEGFERPRWAYVTLGRLALRADPEVFRGGGDARAAALRASRIARAIGASRVGVPPEALSHPIAFASVAGVPRAEMAVLAAFASLCLDVAGDLEGPLRKGDFTLTCRTAPCGPPPHERFVGLLAMRLARPSLSDHQTCRAVAELLVGLLLQHPALLPWLPVDRDPTVRLREPDEHPAIPLAVAPFVMLSAAACEAVNAGPLLDAAFDDSLPVLRELGIAPVPSDLPPP